MRRRVTVLVALIASAACVWAWGPAVWARAALLAAQRRCLDDNVPTARVVFDLDPKRGARLAASDPQYDKVRNAVVWFSKEWERFSQKLVPPGRRPSPTLFIGELRSPLGHRRLVVVTAGWIIVPLTNSGASVTSVQFSFDVVSVGSLLSPPRIVSPADPVRLSNQADFDSATVRFLAGQADAADPSHFTIPFESESERGVVDGYLRDDETVSLELRRPQQPSLPGESSLPPR